MTAPARRSSVAVLAMIVLGLAGVSALAWWKCTQDPTTAFLASYDSTDWIVYPHEARTVWRPASTLETVFRREVFLEDVPATAALELRTFRRVGAIEINGEALLAAVKTEDGNWKRSRTFDLAPHLRPGTNFLEIRVINGQGPPALWLELDLPGISIRSDRSWEASLAGATWDRVRLASDPFPHESLDPGVTRYRPLDALGSLWIHLLVVLAASVGCVLLLRRLLPSGHGATVVVVVLALSWVVLFVNNAPVLWSRDGYDAEAHLEYIQYLLDHHRLPAAGEGWSMFQPPLYYVLAAVVLGPFGLSVADPSAAYLLRLFSAGLGVTQLILLAACLRRLFPEDRHAWMAGLLVGAFLPAHLYTYQYIANDALAVTLSTGAILLALRLLQRREIEPITHLGLGLCLGAALLAKLSALVVAGVVLIVLLGRMAVDRARLTQWLRGPLVAVLATLFTCGWHYAGKWMRYGSPMVGNWDDRVLPPWWQHPGYMTSEFYLRFGDSFRAPFMSAFNGLLDGLYTTAWGDGLIAGHASMFSGMPWNGSVMAAGYVLAVAPCLLAIVGLVLTVIRLVRRPDAVGFLLTGLASATMLALALWPLKLPIYSVIKAYFGLPALLCLCCFAAAALRWIGSRRRWITWIALVPVLTWALFAYASFWIPRGSSGAEARLGWLYAASGADPAYAERHLRTALQEDPSETTAHLGTARLLAAQGYEVEAENHLLELLRIDPEHVRGLYRMGARLEAEGRGEDAARFYRRAVEVRPRHAPSLLALARILNEQGDFAAAERAARDALRTAPDSKLLREYLQRAVEGSATSVKEETP